MRESENAKVSPRHAQVDFEGGNERRDQYRKIDAEGDGDLENRDAFCAPAD